MKTSAGSLVVFCLATIAYFIAKFYLVDSHMNTSGSLGMIIQLVYFAAIIIYQIVINISTTADLCNGVPQVIPAIMYTIIPNFLIFGTLVMLLEIFPGWKSPFSNTIGFMIVNLFMSVSESFNDLLATKGSHLIEKICSDKSILINEITHINFESFFERMSRDGLLIPKYKYNAAYNRLWECVAVKNIVSEGLWYLLTGILVITTTYNALLEIQGSCSYSEAEGQLNKDLFQKEQDKIKKTEEKNKVYYTQKS